MLLNVAAAQMKVGLSIEQNVKRICERISECGKLGLDLVVFPECATIGYDPSLIKGNEEAIRSGLRAIRQKVAAAGCYAVVGTPTFRGRKVYNSALLVDPSGKVICHYNKVHIWPGGEGRYFSPGRSMALAEVKGVRCTMIICADFFYPELTRVPALLGAKLILHPSGYSAGPTTFSYIDEIGRQGFPHIRAVENEAFYIHADYVGSYRDGRRYAKGSTKIIHPCGTTIVAAAPDKEELITARIDTEIPPPVEKFKDRMLKTSFLAPVWRKLLSRAERYLA